MQNIASTNTIPISLFNCGLAKKIFKEVRESGPKIVMENNVAECVLLSPEEYDRIMEEKEDAELLALATERLAHFDPATAIPAEELYAELGITDEDLEGWEDVELE